MERLFVYGSLQPGGSNEQVLAHLDGTWTKARLRGDLVEAGWGAAHGYPGIRVSDCGEWVSGYVFSSTELASFWAELDAFEGYEYKRTIATATLVETHEDVTVFVYALAD